MDQEIYKSPVTGMSIRNSPTPADWEKNAMKVRHPRTEKLRWKDERNVNGRQ